MKHLFAVILFIVVAATAYGQQGKTIYKTHLLDAESRKKVLPVEKGTVLDIVKGKERGYYTVNYNSENYLIFHNELAVIKVPQNTKIRELDQKTLNESILFTNYCLNKYRVQQLTGFGMMITGGIIATTSMMGENTEVLTLGGAALSFGGFIVSLNSFKWLKRAYVYPTNKGVAVGISF